MENGARAVCPRGFEGATGVLVEADIRRVKGWPTPLTATRVEVVAVAEELGGERLVSRQSFLRAFQYMARAFEVAGVGVLEGKRRRPPSSK